MVEKNKQYINMLFSLLYILQPFPLDPEGSYSHLNPQPPAQPSYQQELLKQD